MHSSANFNSPSSRFAVHYKWLLMFAVVPCELPVLGLYSRNSCISQIQLDLPDTVESGPIQLDIPDTVGSFLFESWRVVHNTSWSSQTSHAGSGVTARVLEPMRKAVQKVSERSVHQQCHVWFMLKQNCVTKQNVCCKHSGNDTVSFQRKLPVDRGKHNV